MALLAIWPESTIDHPFWMPRPLRDQPPPPPGRHRGWATWGLGARVPVLLSASLRLELGLLCASRPGGPPMSPHPVIRVGVRVWPLLRELLRSQGES